MRALALTAATATAVGVVSTTAGASGSGTGSAGTTATAATNPLTTPAGQQALSFFDGSLKFGPRTGANPWLSYVPTGARTDLPSWKAFAKGASAKRAASSSVAGARVAAGVAAPPLVHDEAEPTGMIGSNDTRATAERITGFGTRANHRVRVLGDLATPLAMPSGELLPAREDNGSIPLAKATGIGGTGFRQTTGVIGDGPHGSAGTGSGDFDFYRVNVARGATLLASTAESDFDTILLVYNAAGEMVDANDDANGTPQSEIAYDVPAAGTYYVAVSGFLSLPNDPFDSASGSGADAEGAYGLTVGAEKRDIDVYGVRLAAGDVLGVSVAGDAHQVNIARPDGTTMVGGTDVDATFIYPWNSPVPGGGNTTVTYVAEEPGWYTVSLRGGVGSYDATAEVYRPGSESRPAGTVQTVFLDFDGGRINTGVWGGAGIRDLSPLSAFLGRWGIPSSKEGAVIDAITAQVISNIQADQAAYGLNPGSAVRVVTSRNSPDIYGQPNVSRVVVGGTIDQSGIRTIGIAQFIDPGNYATEDQALVLLDVLSMPNGDEASLNFYLRPGSDRVKFVAQGVGNVVSHEIGHLLGNFHTDNADDVANLIDAGGDGFSRLFGVGPDGVGGTSDDVDVDFTEDTYIPYEGFTGLEDSLNVSAWANSLGKG